MKKFLLSAFVVISFAIYSLSQRGNSSVGSNLILPAISPSAPAQNISDQTGSNVPTSAPAPAPTPAPSPAPTPSPNPTPAPVPSPVPAPAPVPAPKPKGQYTDGSYTGSSEDAYYGYVQVRVSIQGGRITDVVFLSYPNDRGTSREINGQAMPYLKQEAIAAQSANVDIVSGATDTSLAFRQSLANALSQAKS